MVDFGNLRDKVAVVGVGHTQYARRLGRSSMDLISEALELALLDCGLTKGELNGACGLSGRDSPNLEAQAKILGLDLEWYGQASSHSSQSTGVIQWAAFALHYGLANYVACVMGQGWDPPLPLQHLASAFDTRVDEDNHIPYGMTSPGAGAALAVRRYFHKYGATSEQLAAICIASRKYAALNPNAILRQPLTVESYLTSRYVCEPLRRWDYSLTSHGAACLILTTAERAKDLKQPPVYISGMQGVAAGPSHYPLGPDGLGLLQQEESSPNPHPEDLKIYQTSQIMPQDVDVLYIFDPFSFFVWTGLERFAFCKLGEAPAFTQGGRIEPGGEFPINTNGGLLSEAHLSGWNHQIELVRQLRGECGQRQVPGAEIGMWINYNGDSIVYRH